METRDYVKETRGAMERAIECSSQSKEASKIAAGRMAELALVIDEWLTRPAVARVTV